MTRSSVKITLIFFSFKKHSHTTPHLKKKDFPLISSTIIKNLNYINLMKKNFISTFHKIQYFKTIQDTSVGVINHQSQWTCTITPPLKPMNLPSITLDTGVFSATTCNHPPGAAHRSITTLALWRNSNFLFSWINLNADLAL